MLVLCDCDTFDVNVQDLLAVLASFGCTCEGCEGVGGR